MQQPTAGKNPASRGKKKAAVPLLLAIPDDPIPPEDDHDPHVTKLGGVPVWFRSDTPPTSSVCQCRVCRQPMYLIFQGYVPLPDSIYHRIIYVWACNRRACMRKKGSFSVLRSHQVDPGCLAEQRRKAKAQKEREQKSKPAFGAPPGFQLGDLWGTDSSFSMAPQTQTDTQVDTLATKIKALHLHKNDPALPPPENILADPVDTSALPRFPGEYLYIAEETLQGTMFGLDTKHGQQYATMEAEVDASAPSAHGEWQGEAYEKQQLPRGLDKQFKKFTERVEEEPNQCVRYEWDGTPLLYCQPREMPGQSKCSACGCQRVFEFQLMPNVLSILPTVEYASTLAASQVSQNNSNAMPDSWSVGMEFGTILIYVCKNDCHPGEPEDVSYVEEEAIVQYELD